MIKDKNDKQIQNGKITRIVLQAIIQMRRAYKGAE